MFQFLLFHRPEYKAYLSLDAMQPPIIHFLSLKGTNYNYFCHNSFAVKYTTIFLCVVVILTKCNFNHGSYTVIS